MTVEQFKRMLNSNYGVEKNWPARLMVDADTYANVCQAVFENNINKINGPGVSVEVGPRNGIKFKNIELILNSNE